MDIKASEFAKQLGKKVLHNEREYILYGVTSNHLLCLNGTSTPFPVAYDECKMIFDSFDEYERLSRENFLPASYVVIRDNDKYIHPGQISTITQEETQILNLICQCAKTTPTELLNNYKSRKKELVQARMVHMTIRKCILFKTEYLSRTGYVYHKDHSTASRAIKIVSESLNGYDVNFRERFRPVWGYIKENFNQIGEEINLNWL